MTIITSDNPIERDEDDLLDRVAISNTLAGMILTAPPGASFRLGVYGGWGEGKTSVLRLMERRLLEGGHVTVWLSPWGTRTAEDLLARLLETMGAAVHVDADPITRLASGAEKPQELRKSLGMNDQRVAVLDALVGALGERTVRGSTQKHEAAQQLAAICQALGDRKLIVLVDDLDRARPEVIPDFLLAVRDALDLPNFFFVLALAPEIVQEGLRQMHQGWSEVGSFLEKIVELPVTLPVILPAAIERFTRAQVESLEGAIDADVIAGLAPVLPRNPRRLKVFLRYLAGLQPVLGRFESNEVNLASMYLCQMLRLEFPGESNRLFEDERAVGALASGNVTTDMRAASDESELPEYAYAPARGEGRTRFLRICDAIRQMNRLSSEYSLSEQFYIIERPPVLTWKETFALWQTFRETPRDQRVALLQRAVAPHGRLDARIAGALFTRLVELRDRIVTKAMDRGTQVEVRGLLDLATQATEIIISLLADIGVMKRNAVTANDWIQLYEHVRSWAPWRDSADAAKLRGEEAVLLRASIVGMSAFAQKRALQLLDEKSANDREGLDRTHPEFVAVHDEVVATLQESVIRNLLARFSRPEGIATLIPAEDTDIEKRFALDPAQPFHLPHVREELYLVAERAPDDPTVHRNFFNYFEYLTYGAFDLHSHLDRSAVRGLLSDSQFVDHMWHAAVARPLNRRMMAALLEHRTSIVQELHVPVNALPLPGWWVRSADNA